jgi:hypothetical protein
MRPMLMLPGRKRFLLEMRRVGAGPSYGLLFDPGLSVYDHRTRWAEGTRY